MAGSRHAMFFDVSETVQQRLRGGRNSQVGTPHERGGRVAARVSGSRTAAVFCLLSDPLDTEYSGFCPRRLRPAVNESSSGDLGRLRVWLRVGRGCPRLGRAGAPDPRGPSSTVARCHPAATSNAARSHGRCHDADGRSARTAQHRGALSCRARHQPPELAAHGFLAPGQARGCGSVCQPLAGRCASGWPRRGENPGPAGADAVVAQGADAAVAPVPLRTQGHCDPCEMGIAPSPDTVMVPAPTGHRLAV